MSFEINTNIAPKELIVGISGEKCYVTYKDSKGKLNSEKSWTDWSSNSKNPLIVENKFSNGFRLAGVNHRWSSNASNSENMLIEHPLFNKCFEISMGRFMQIAKRCVITNGVFDAELIMTNSRDIVFMDEYEKLVQDFNSKNETKSKKLNENKSKMIPSKDQVPGKVYVDIKNNNVYRYLGTAEIDSELKHVYYYGSDLVKSTGAYRNSIPVLVNYRSYGDEYSALYNGYFSVVKTKKQVMLASNDYQLNSKNLFADYTEKDWKIIETAYNSVYPRTHYYTQQNWAKASKTIKINFKEDYLQCK